MLNIEANLETGTAKLTQAIPIKAGRAVPVTLTFSSNPGDNPGIELAFSPQSSSPTVVAYLGTFDRQNETTFTGMLNASDTRLATALAGKEQQVFNCELTLTNSDSVPFPNFQVTIQRPILSGPGTTEGGPIYVTQTSGDARYLRSGQNLAEINAAGAASRAAARSNLALGSLALRTPVSQPASDTAAGLPGDYNITGNSLYIYIGDGTSHAWLCFTGANAFTNA